MTRSAATFPPTWNQTNTTADVHASPDGKFVYASNRGHDSLVCFAVGVAGRLSLVGWTPTGGHHPRAFGISPSGKWVVVLNQDSDTVKVFAYDGADGALTPTGQVLDITGPECVMWAASPVAGNL